MTSCFFWRNGSSHPDMSFVKIVLKNLTYLFLKTETPGQEFFCEFHKILKAAFIRTPRMAGSVATPDRQIPVDHA